MSIRVVTIDNHEIVRDGIAARITADAPDIDVVASTASVEDFQALDIETDIILLDLILDDGPSSEEIPTLVERGCRVLLYTTEERPIPLRNAVALGANGVLLKSDPPSTMIDAIRATAAGEFSCSGPLAHALLSDDTAAANLSPRQVEILRALDEGLDYRHTALLVGCSEGAIKTHLQRIREKLRSIGIEPGNAHHLTRIATEQGHLE